MVLFFFSADHVIVGHHRLTDELFPAAAWFYLGYMSTCSEGHMTKHFNLVINIENVYHVINYILLHYYFQAGDEEVVAPMADRLPDTNRPRASCRLLTIRRHAQTAGHMTLRTDTIGWIVSRPTGITESAIIVLI